MPQDTHIDMLNAEESEEEQTMSVPLMNKTDENNITDDTIVPLRLLMDIDLADADDQGISTDARLFVQSHHRQTSRKL